MGSTRAHRLTFPSFKRQVIDQLNGDLALAIGIDENYDYNNPLWQHAKYRWTAPQFDDMGDAFDLAQGWLCQEHNLQAPDWRSILRLKGIWQGKIRSADPQPSLSTTATFYRWVLLRGMQQDDVLDRYDRFVITRSDFVWLCPHPPLSVLDRNAIWVPNGEHYGGINDRHAVVSRAHVADLLNIVSEITLHPTELYEEMKHQPSWNTEQFLAHHLMRKGLLQKVKHFPYVMYLAREIGDHTPTWAGGRYESAVRHYVKYEGEFRTAKAQTNSLRCSADWQKESWMQPNFEPVEFPPRTLWCRLRNACEREFLELRSSGTRFGPLHGLVRFLGRLRQERGWW